jgi:hypothetical protein
MKNDFVATQRIINLCKFTRDALFQLHADSLISAIAISKASGRRRGRPGEVAQLPHQHP